MTLCGGYASYSFVGLRAQAGTTIEAHTSGILGNNLFNKNVDLITVAAFAPSTSTGEYNQIDTAGTGDWGGTGFQATPAGQNAATFPTLTGNKYYLPIKKTPYDAQGNQYYNENDILLIDTVEAGGEHAEFVKVTRLPQINSTPYYIEVERLPFGTINTVSTQHPDTTAIFKCNVQYDSTWITQGIDNSGTEDNVYLSTFGGSLTGKTERQTAGNAAYVSATAPGDYVIISRRDTNSDGIFDDGEIFELKSSITQVAKSFRIKKGCDTNNEITVFEINSVTGDVTINNNKTTVNGTLNLVGGCGGTAGIYPSPDPTTDDHFNLKNALGTVFDVNLCNGDTLMGSTQGTVFALADYWGSTAVAHTTTSVVQTYRYDKWTLQADGPITTASAAFTNNDTAIPIAGNNAAFSVGDLIMVQDGSNEMEIIQLTSPATQTSGQWYLNCGTNSSYPGGGRGSEGTAVKNQWASGVQIRKIKKYVNATTLATALGATRTQVESPNTDPKKIRVKLMNSDLIADKLDTDHFFKITTGTDIEWFYADSIDGNAASDGTKYAKSKVTSTNPDGTVNRDKYFGGGALTVHDDFELYSGNFRMYGSDGQTLLFNVANDDNHPADPASIDEKTGTNGIFFNGQMKLRGDLMITEESCESNGTCSLSTNFKVESTTGDLSVGAIPATQTPLYIKGRIDQSDSGSSSQPILHVDNLGGAGTNGTVGPKDFLIYQDGSIDAFGINRYWTRNGGRRYTYVEQSATGIGQTQANPLQPNNNYLLNNPSGTNMVLYLPATAETGDVIRFVEVAGTATYNTSIVIRALKVNNLAVAVQGDTTGSKIQAGAGQLTTAWDSGEMIVQTRNASFGLIYVGATDAAGDPNASSIPNNLRGWWLAEL
jgi:hypothetical protein